MTQTVAWPPLVIVAPCPVCQNKGVYLAPCPLPGIPQQIVVCRCPKGLEAMRRNSA